MSLSGKMIEEEFNRLKIADSTPLQYITISFVVDPVDPHCRIKPLSLDKRINQCPYRKEKC